MRKYKSGTIWCFWRWTEVDSEYIGRLHVVKTPWFAICLHWIKKPDPEPFLHDHPVSFLSVILRGGYTDEVLKWVYGTVPLHYRSKNRWLHWIPGTEDFCHTIREVRPNTLTLCFMGPKTREWGFHTDTGWVMWKDYYAAKRASAA